MERSRREEGGKRPKKNKIKLSEPMDARGKENNENSFSAKTHRVEKLMYGLDVLSKQVDGNGT